MDLVHFQRRQLCAPPCQLQGELAFDRLLRVDGTFEGQLLSSGSLFVGATGLVVGPVLGLKAVVCEGTIRGTVAADKVMLGPGARLEGATCQFVAVCCSCCCFRCCCCFCCWFAAMFM